MYTTPGATAQTFTADNAGTTTNTVKYGETSAFSVYAKGTWGGGTLKLQASPSDSSTTDWQDVPSISFTADGVKTVSGYYARRLRWVLTGSTAPSLTATIVGLSTGTTTVNS